MEFREGKEIESPERKRLQDLESEGKWVFHGSEVETEILEPRQAHDYSATGEATPDDQPAIFASPSADIAIFMAIVNQHNAPDGFRSGFVSRLDGSIEFYLTKETMDQLHNARGYVYVFDKNGFTPRSSRESLAYNSVKPKETILVTEQDLPKDIIIKDF